MASIGSEINVKFVVDVILATSTLTRSCIEFSNEISELSPKTLINAKATYFVSVIKLPGSIYTAGISILEIGKVNSLKSGAVYAFIVIKNVSFVGKNIFDLLKGMKAFGYLQERHFWIFTPSTLVIGIGSAAFSLNLCLQIFERSRCQESKKTTATLGILGSTLKAGGIILLNVPPLFNFSAKLPAQILLNICAITSLSKVILSKDHVN